MNRMPQRLLALTSVLLLSAILWAEDKTGKESKSEALFTAEAYIEHVKYLASDELAGRLPASEGSERAAEYIVEHFRAAGCEPAGPDGGWFQPFEVRRGKQLIDEKASLEISGLQREWKVREDWIPFPFTEMEDVEGPLAFAGYGIQAKGFDYDDFAEFDAEGKVLLILRYEPKDEDPKAEFGGESPSRHAFFFRKARVAAKHGAKALLVVNPPNRNPDQDELYAFDVFNTQQTYQVPMVHISREIAGAILQHAGMPDLKTLQEQLDKERKSLSKDLGLTIKLCIGVEPNRLPAKNVLGMIPGDGSTDDTIVVGAHRDHLGVVPRQFQRDDMTPMIHNGADDNAAGTAAVLELARVIGNGPELHRNVLFIAFDAEEMGLLGSRHFVTHPTIDLENIRAMINFDMIGRLKQNKYTVFGTQSGQEFPALVRKYAEPVDLTYKAPGGMAGGSDHTPFIRRNIPAMFAFTGIHKDYHQPEDDWELIDAGGAATVLQMWHPIIVELANMEDGPTFVDPSTQPAEDVEAPRPAVEENQALDQQQGAGANEEKESDAPPSRRSLRVRLGIIPDMVGDDQPGMLVDSVMDGGAAKAAGILDGDRIMKIGDENVRDIYAYMRAMREFKPGDVVDVVITRDGEEKTLKVKLQASNYRRNQD